MELTSTKAYITFEKNTGSCPLKATQMTCHLIDLHEGTISDNGRVNNYGALGANANHFYNMRISNLQDAESAFNSTLWPDSSVLGGALQLHSKVALLLHFCFASFVLGVDLTVLNLKLMVSIRKSWIQISSKSWLKLRGQGRKLFLSFSSAKK